MINDMRKKLLTKNELRAVVKAKREELGAKRQAEASAAMTGLLVRSPLFAAAKTVFCYVSMPDEPDTAKLIAAALDAGKTVCVPRCYGKGKMDAVPIRSFSELNPGRYGIPAPGADAKALPPSQIDLVVVPCLAAGKDGKRLGHGAGYYDRYLASCPGESVCLCFDELLTDRIPTDRYDVLMDHVLTERGWYDRRPAAHILNTDPPSVS